MPMAYLKTRFGAKNHVENEPHVFGRKRVIKSALKTKSYPQANRPKYAKGLYQWHT